MAPTDMDTVRQVAAQAEYFAVVGVARPDGSVHTSVVKAGVFDDPISDQPVVAMVNVGGARKTDYIRRAGRATAVFQQGGRWVSVEGPARLAGPDDAAPTDLPQLLRDIFVAAGGTHDDWDEYDRAMAEDGRTAVLISPERITTRG